MAEPFLLFGKPYRWDGNKLQRIPDQEARCVQEIERGDLVLRCHHLAGHKGSHQAAQPNLLAEVESEPAPGSRFSA